MFARSLFKFDLIKFLRTPNTLYVHPLILSFGFKLEKVSTRAEKDLLILFIHLQLVVDHTWEENPLID